MMGDVDKKALYLATNMRDLTDIAVLTIGPKTPAKQLMECSRKIIGKVTQLLKTSPLDEEQMYIFYYRILDIWSMITETAEYKQHKKYYNSMVGKDIQRAMAQLESLHFSLEKRYEKLSEELLMVTSNNNCNKKPRETQQKENNEEISSDEAENEKEPPVSISCRDLQEIVLYRKNVLIVDVRSKEDFDKSRIDRLKSVINFPEDDIRLSIGKDCQKLRVYIRHDVWYWDHRDEFDNIVLLDWNTEEKTLVPGNILFILKNIVLKWDLGVTYKNPPVILEGGYERFLDMYPVLTTNANIERPPPPPDEDGDASETPLLNNIEYPLDDLEDTLTVQPQKLHNAVIVAPDMSKQPRLVPQVDRTTKPELPSKPVAVVKQPEVPPVTEPSIPPPAEMEVEEPENTTSVVPESPAKQDRPTPASSPSLSVTIEGTDSPIRTSDLSSEKESEDGEITYRKLKTKSSSMSSGLKRASSSPNISQLIDERELGRKPRPPQFDRTKKPTPKFTSFSDYSPSRLELDAVYGKKDPGLTGLKNLGNLCYMNSIMQCVSNTEALKKQLLSLSSNHEINTKSKTNGQVFSAVKSIIAGLWAGEYKCISCGQLKDIVGQLRVSFSGYDQQDSHEFLTLLMDWLHEDLNCKTPVHSNLDGALEATGEKAWGEFIRNNRSIVLDLFYGQQKSTITCRVCGKESVTFEPFSNLSLPLPSKEKCRLQDCLTLYLAGEVISGWNCPSCKEARTAIKKFDITRLPPILVIHLKRFMADRVGGGWCHKRLHMVDFPLEDLDMTPFTVENSEQRFHTYNLYAVSNHYGTMERGHYTAFCKNRVLKKWYRFDDQDVQELSPSGVKSPAAYILFYNTIDPSC